MSERRLYAPALPLAGGTVALDAAAAHHARVLRLKEGAEVELFDGRGSSARARLTRLDANGAIAEAEPAIAANRGPRAILVQALAKGDKLDGIVRMATEIGAAAIHLVEVERSIVRGAKPTRLDRLERIAREAARQSGRSDVPAIAPAAGLREIADRPPQDSLRLALAPGASIGIDEACRAGGEAWILIGPEGGLSEAELAILGDRGWIAVGMGSNVLRVETAAPVALALAIRALGGMRA